MKNRPLSNSSNQNHNCNYNSSSYEYDQQKQKRLSCSQQQNIFMWSTKNTFRDNHHSNYQSSNYIPMCKYHPSSLLQNFCDCKQCLLPMCPTCVTLHTQQHQQQNTFGHYLSFQSVTQQVKTSLQSSLKTFQQFSKDYSYDFGQKIKIKDKMKNRFDQFRSRIYKEVARIMDDIQTKLTVNLQRFLQSQEQKYKVLQEKVQNQYQKVKKQLQTLGTDRGVKTIIQYHSNRNKDLSLIKEQIKDQIIALKKQGLLVQMGDAIPTSLRQVFKSIQLKQRILQKQSESLIKWKRIGKSFGNQFDAGSSQSQIRKNSQKIEKFLNN